MTEITDFGMFYSTVDKETHTIYYESEDGLDWYDIVRALATWKREDGQFINSVYGVWATVDDTGMLTCVDKDPTKLSPNGKRVLGIDSDTSKIKPRMIWDGKEIK